MAIYEKIEWTNTWAEETGRSDKLRVLLVGDSIANGARATGYARHVARAGQSLVPERA